MKAGSFILSHLHFRVFGGFFLIEILLNLGLKVSITLLPDHFPNGNSYWSFLAGFTQTP
jgi:hypothetical protein